MKKILYLALVVLMLVGTTGCENFLDTESYTKKNSENFPVNEDDANQLLVGVYASLSKAIASCQLTYFFAAEMASDDRFGGGGENDKLFQSYNHLMLTNLNELSTFWSDRYVGVNRANMAIATMDNIADENIRNQKLGEALFLRAFFYFDLVQMFGDIPLIEAAPEDVKAAQTAPEQKDQKEVFKVIATDLKKAYDIMPEVQWNAVSSGTVTKWAVAGLMSRVFLFYTGFYGESSVPTEDGAISKQDVIAALNNLVAKSGHSLTPDFRSIWAYTNSTAKSGGYAYVQNAPVWVKDGTNPEVVFAIKCTNLADWGTTIGYSNQYALFFSIRNQNTDYKNTFPFGQGWGAGPVNPALWNEWDSADLRKAASIYNVEDEAKLYTYGNDSQMEESGLWQKKIVAITRYKSNGDLANHFASSTDYYGTGDDDNVADNFQLGFVTDLIQIRYADVLLMLSELTETADGMNQVRARVGLPAVTYSLANLQKERHHELAFEGLRWGDLRRWGIVEQELPKMYNQPIFNRGVATTMKQQSQGGVAARYKATKGFWPIPQSEIDLSNGALKQNPGWGTDALFNNWAD